MRRARRLCAALLSGLAGAGGSVDARVLVKGNVNLSLAGTGQGINLGIAFGSFRIVPR